MTTMTSNPTPTPLPPPSLRPKVSYGMMVVHDVVSRNGARLGLIWIAIVALLGALAPVLASSDPFLVKTKAGDISSPWLRQLTSGDVTLLLMTPVAIIALFLGKFTIGNRILTVLGIGLVVMIICSFTISPPARLEANAYNKYRLMEARGEVEWMWSAPIPYSPNDRLSEQEAEKVRAMPPSGEHWLGTESFKSSVASRLIHGCRIALTIGFVSTTIAVTIGIIIGGLMGYFAGKVDLLGMRLVEIFEAIPQLYLLLAFVAFFPDNPVILGITIPRIYLIMTIIGLTGWTGYARYIRAEFFKLRKQDFVQSAIACGLPLRSILFKHMLPNGIAPVLVGASFGVGSAIIYESTLSYLGIGLIEEPSWGGLLKQALGDAGKFAWWIATFPGLAIFLTVFSYNLIGEAMRDAIDPHTQRLNQG